MSQVAAVGAGNFENEVVLASKEELVIVDFWAEWCPPCKMLSPILDRVAEKYSGRLKVVKCNIEENQDIANQYAISSIPNLVFFRDGQVIDQSVGYAGEAQLADKIEDVLSS